MKAYYAFQKVDSWIAVIPNIALVLNMARSDRFGYRFLDGARGQEEDLIFNKHQLYQGRGRRLRDYWMSCLAAGTPVDISGAWAGAGFRSATAVQRVQVDGKSY